MSIPLLLWMGGAGSGDGVDAPEGAFAVTVSPSDLSKYRTGSGNATTGSCTAVPGGGVASYTYAWAEYLPDDVEPSGIVANSPSVATTSFKGYVANGDSKSAIFRVTVTDSTPGTPLVGYGYVNVFISATYSGSGLTPSDPVIE